MSPSASKQRLQLVLAGVLLTLLLSAVFTLGSLRVPFEPSSWRELLTLYAVSSFITAALLVFSLVLIRTLLRLLAERKKDHLGARFKTKMVLGATALSLLPILFMFFVSYALLNRTLARWFPRPLEIATEQRQGLMDEMAKAEHDRLIRLAAQASAFSPADSVFSAQQSSALCNAADAFWLADLSAKILKVRSCDSASPDPSIGASTIQANIPHFLQATTSGAEVWKYHDQLFLTGKSLRADAAFYVARQVPADFLARLSDIRSQTRAYDEEKQHLRAFKTQMLLILCLFTLLLFFAVMWLSLFLAKQVTVPIQALAVGTRELKAGNFDYQVPEQAHDELGVLVRSFNTMTTQLRDSRAQIDQFTSNLQQAVLELERRRQLMETVLENIPTGVISLDADGRVLRSNAAIARMFGSAGRDPLVVQELLGEDAARAIQLLMRRALRMGVVSRELEMPVAGRVLHVAVTVSSLGPRRANTGFVLVFDDLTELLRAQKSAAWQEVARRIAHEIKNPLTPIQLSAQRLSRYLDRRDSSTALGSGDSELARLVQECSRLIEREVGTLAALVNEFSQFVRFPSARLEPADVNTIVREAVEVFSGRLDGITLTTSLPDSLPAVRADVGLLRSVVVNLIDNAAEALESAAVRNIRVTTHFNSDSDSVEIAVEDTGHGISPEDKDRLFLPHFSTKDRGTGLGLAIAARIVAEHNGAIRVEDGHPVGSRFLIELPISEPVPSPDRPAHLPA